MSRILTALPCVLFVGETLLKAKRLLNFLIEYLEAIVVPIVIKRLIVREVIRS
jgi:hypothetical protein